MTRSSNPHSPAHAALPRRSFIEYREVPGLLFGVANGRAAALRRVLGARKGGRIGVALAAPLALAATAELRAALATLGAYALLAMLAALRHRACGFRLYHTARLLLWTLPAPLLLVTGLRAAVGSSALLPILAVLAGWWLLDRGLRRGLGGPLAQSSGAAAAPEGGRTSLGTGSPGRE